MGSFLHRLIITLHAAKLSCYHPNQFLVVQCGSARFWRTKFHLMAFFEDLTPYTYFDPEREAPGTVNIGWLDAAHLFPTGPTSDEFQDKLGRLCELRVQQTRGSHPCELCSGRDRPVSSSEMRVAGSRRVYAAPSLVHHYVAAHGYRPPEEFIEAVMACDEGRVS